MRRRWDCMLLAAGCAADEKPDVFVLGVGTDVGDSCGSNRTRLVPIKLLRFPHAVRRHHLATIHIRTPQCAENNADLAMADTNGIGRSPLARSRRQSPANGETNGA